MIAILGYGLGNTKAIANIFHRLNTPHLIATTEADLRSATKLVLPGVGAFDKAMDLLNRSGMRDRLDSLVLQERLPVLGICVGMQIMAERGDEGNADGLGWIEGRVIEFRSADLKTKPRTPHMGWNEITPLKEDRLLEGIDFEKGFYFLHSYHLVCSRPDDTLATSHYGTDFAAAVSTGNVFGVQFHPEKSHQNGVNVFRNFAEL